MRFLALILAAMSPVLAAFAQAQDPPSRVGRLAFIEGQVSLYQDPEDGWRRAYLNYPLTSENSIWTDRRSRAEMRVSGIAVRLDEGTQLDIARLDERSLDTFVAQGAIHVRVRHFENSHLLDFSTPHARFRLYGVGRYRIDVDPASDETSLTVFQGSAAMRSGRGDVQVRAGSTLRVYGGSRPEFWFERAQSNAFDAWAQARDQRWRDERARKYVSAYMTGYEELDAYGEWREEPDFGVLWYPTRVDRDWAPYRYGRWDYVRPWGWTWIDDAPWGYAPSHYGRWVYVRDRWAWHPGTRVERPAWAPALVGWVGGSAAGANIGAGGPSVGWYPLSPWDRYEPWHRASPGYVNQINIIVRNQPQREDRQRWREWTRDQGATVVRREQFGDSRPVNQALIQVTPEMLRRMQAAPPSQALPPPSEIRQRRAQMQPENVSAPPAREGMQQQPQAQGQAQRQEGARGSEGAGRGAIPIFQRPQQAPAPAPANEQAAKGQPGPAPNPAARGPAGTPPGQGAVPPGQGGMPPGLGAAPPGQGGPNPGQGEGRGRSAQQEQLQRAGREAEEREKQAREAQQARERQAREAQQARERQARDSQQQQERAAREAQQAQEKQAREAQQQQQQQQQAQERQAREAQQAKERQAREAQQAQEKQAREAQQAQEKQRTQQAQERQAREAERQAREQQRGQKPPPPQPQPAQPQGQPAPQAQPPAQPPQGEGQGRGRGKDRDGPKKPEEEEEEKSKGRGR